jgi:Icc-related predicted phosphoesterase
MKIAHFSDWHMSDDADEFDEEIEYLENCIDTAVDKKVDHFVLSGDMVDSKNLKDYKYILDTFAQYNIDDHTILSMVPGNHEIHPLDLDDIKGSIRNAYSAPRNQKTFNSYMSRFVDKSEYVYSKTVVPFIKNLDSSTLLVGLDTVNATTMNLRDLIGLFSRNIDIKAVVGQFTDEDESELMESLSQMHYSKYKTKILVMHHYPLEGVEFDRVEVPLLGSFNVPGDFEEEDLERVQDFIKSVGFDYVLCGHAHYLNGVDTLGKSKIVNAAVDDEYGFQLIDTVKRKVEWIEAEDIEN